ncbi:hypothetical protein FRC16_002027 [Serendipita sp. 398]|nr:hypothetical protein FRC16_002027 [Serendipita sp. 398]
MDCRKDMSVEYASPQSISSKTVQTDRSHQKDTSADGVNNQDIICGIALPRMKLETLGGANPLLDIFVVLVEARTI